MFPLGKIRVKGTCFQPEIILCGTLTKSGPFFNHYFIKRLITRKNSEGMKTRKNRGMEKPAYWFFAATETASGN